MQQDWSAFNTRFLTLRGGTTGVPQGDYIAIGLVTNTAYTASLANVSPSAVASSIVIWDSGTVGDGIGIDGTFAISSTKSGAGFFSQQIYLLAVNAPTVAAATQVGVFTNPSWIFPASDAAAPGAIDLSDVGTTALIGALTDGTITTPGDIAGGDAAALGPPVAVTGLGTNTWNGGTGSWSNASNWSLNVVPDNNNGSGTNYVVRIDGGNAITSAVAIDPFLSFTVDRVVLDSGDKLTITNGASLTITNGATFNGTVTLASDGNNTILQFNNNGATMLGGTGQVLLAGTAAYADHLSANGTLTIGSGITVHGGGNISGDCANPLVNQGTISADLSNQTLTVSCFANQSRLSALNGGTLYLAGNWSNSGVISNDASFLNLGGNFTTAGLGTLKNIGGTNFLNGTLVNTNTTFTLTATTGSLLLNGGTIQGGTVAASGGAQLLILGNGGYSGTLNGVTLNANLTVPDYAYLYVVNNLTNNAVITVASDGSYSQIYFLGTETVSGSGQFLLAGTNPNANHLRADNGGTITFGSGITIHGGGHREKVAREPR